MGYTDVRRSLLDFPYMPTNHFYLGSKSAWLPRSAFNIATYSRNRFQPWSFRWVYVFPTLCIAPFLAFVIVLVGVPLGVFLAVEKLTQCSLRDSMLWKELKHF